MLLPAFGLIFSYTLFAMLAVLMLGFIPGPGLRPATVFAFVLSAHVGCAAFAILYHLLFRDSYQPSATGSIAIFVGILVFVALFGWIGATLAARFLKKT